MSIDSSPSMQDRLAALKAAKVETPLWVFLAIYLKARRECYIDYMEGAKALVEFLKPIKFPAESELEAIRMPKFYQGSYEAMELIKCLSNNPYDLQERSYKERSMFYTLIKRLPTGDYV